MRRLDTRLEGPILLEPTAHGDERGFFAETYRRATFEQLGIHGEFVQHNHSRSRKGIVRGMHFQVDRGLAKLVRCGRGTILDVVVDLRKGSPTYAQHEAFELSDTNMRLLYAPYGFAHGFCVLSDVADVLYLQDGYYDPAAEQGIRYDDPDIAIAWPADLELTPSERDRTAPLLKDIADELPFVYR